MPTKNTSARGISIGHSLPQGKSVRGDDIRVNSCCDIPQQCEPGDVFVVANDENFNAFEQAETAISNGAVAVVTESILPVRVPQFIVNDARVAFAQLCHSLAGSPTDQMCTVGITGSHGKTVTQMILASVLEAAGHNVGAIGSLGYCDGHEAVVGSQTTPAAPELSEWLRRMNHNQVSHALIEASGESLVQRQLSGIKLDAAVITNVRREHVELHGSMGNLRNAKARLLDSLKSGGFAVLNADDPGCKRIISDANVPTMTFSMQQDAEVTGTVLERLPSEQTFLLEAGSESIPVRTGLVGDQHVQNCLAAACVGLVMGIDLPTIARGIEDVQQLPTRLERVECGQDFSVFVDGANSTESLAETLATIRAITANRLFCVLNPFTNVSSEQRAAIGRMLETTADECILTEDVANPERSNICVHDVLDGFDRPAICRLMPNRAKAICLALGEAQRGDTVLLIGNPRNPTGCEATDRTRFFDRNIAQYWLRTVGTSKSSPWLTV